MAAGDAGGSTARLAEIHRRIFTEGQETTEGYRDLLGGFLDLAATAERRAGKPGIAARQAEQFAARATGDPEHDLDLLAQLVCS